MEYWLPFDVPTQANKYSTKVLHTQLWGSSSLNSDLIQKNESIIIHWKSNQIGNFTKIEEKPTFSGKCICLQSL